MAAVTPEPIMKHVLGFMASKHLFTANEIGLFEALAPGPATAQELVGRTGVPLRTLAIVAAAMVGLGLLVQEDDRYRNSEPAAAFLNYPDWQRFAEAVRTDQGRARFGQFTPEQQQILSAGVEAFSRLGAAALASAYDFSHNRRLLDVAGGTGSFLLAVMRRYPALQGTLFELPGACAVARQKLADEPECNQIEVVEGDLFRDPLPRGHNVLLVANTVHVLSAAHNVELLGKLRAGAEPGARLLLVDLWTDASHAQPTAAALMSGTFLLTSGEGQAYSEKEADDWLGRTSWQKRERRPLAGPSSVIIAEAV